MYQQIRLLNRMRAAIFGFQKNRQSDFHQWYHETQVSSLKTDSILKSTYLKVLENAFFIQNFISHFLGKKINRAAQGNRVTQKQPLWDGDENDDFHWHDKRRRRPDKVDKRGTADNECKKSLQTSSTPDLLKTE